MQKIKIRKRRGEDARGNEVTVVVLITYGRGDAQLSMRVSPPSRYMNTKEATIRMNSVTTWIVNITNATLAES
jgi:hypothetical protein